MTRDNLAHQRQANHRLAIIRHVEEVSGNVSATCRCYGISRPTYYTWLRRYEEKGLKKLEDRSAAPHHMPTATPAEVVEKVLWLRQQYHVSPEKITMYLHPQLYHDVTIRLSGVWRILHEAGINRLPAS